MTPDTLADVAKQITAVIGEQIRIEHCRSVPGGCINDASILESDCGKSWFVKSNRDAPGTMFRAEADGLRAMAATETIRVPEVVTIGQLDSGQAFLVLEAIQSGDRDHLTGDFFETFGHSLAEMHRQGRGDEFGFNSDNWLGSTVQLNPSMLDWNKFWIEARLIPQLKLARDNGVSTPRLQKLGDCLIDRIDTIFGKCLETPSLIHGDLWSGNYLADKNGQPVIFDPACYYAHREAEFGMTKLFGDFPRAFYHAYNEAWPLAEGWESRVELYTLYHLLNHLNLFGSSYLGGCLEILERHTR